DDLRPPAVPRQGDVWYLRPGDDDRLPDRLAGTRQLRRFPGRHPRPELQLVDRRLAAAAEEGVSRSMRCCGLRRCEERMRRSNPGQRCTYAKPKHLPEIASSHSLLATTEALGPGWFTTLSYN